MVKECTVCWVLTRISAPDDGGVQSSAEEYADRHIRSHLQADRIAQ